MHTPALTALRQGRVVRLTDQSLEIIATTVGQGNDTLGTYSYHQYQMATVDGIRWVCPWQGYLGPVVPLLTPNPVCP